MRKDDTVYPGCCLAKITIILFYFRLFFFLFLVGDLGWLFYRDLGVILIYGRLFPQKVLPKGAIFKVAISYYCV